MIYLYIRKRKQTHCLLNSSEFLSPWLPTFDHLYCFHCNTKEKITSSSKIYNPTTKKKHLDNVSSSYNWHDTKRVLRPFPLSIPKENSARNFNCVPFTHALQTSLSLPYWNSDWPSSVCNDVFTARDVADNDAKLSSSSSHSRWNNFALSRFSSSADFTGPCLLLSAGARVMDLASTRAALAHWKSACSSSFFAPEAECRIMKWTRGLCCAAVSARYNAERSSWEVDVWIEEWRIMIRVLGD